MSKESPRTRMRTQKVSIITRSARCNHCLSSKWVRAKANISPLELRESGEGGRSFVYTKRCAIRKGSSTISGILGLK